MADSTFTFRVDDEVEAAFAEVAAAQGRTAAQLSRVLMRHRSAMACGVGARRLVPR